MAQMTSSTSKKKILFVEDEKKNADNANDLPKGSSSSSSPTLAGDVKNGPPSISKKMPTSTSRANDNDDEDNSLSLTVNKKYAREYQHRKEQEELRQIQNERRQRGILDDDGNEHDEDDSDSSDEEEDEDGVLLTPSANVQFLKTIKALRRKEAAIYDPKNRFFEDAGSDNEDASDDDDDDVSDENEERPEKRKPKRFKDVIREQILEQIEEEEKDKKGLNTSLQALADSRSKLAYDEQQDELRRAFLQESSKLGDDDDGVMDKATVDDDDGEDWMVVKKKVIPETDNELEKEAAEHLKEIEQLSKRSDTFKDPRGEIEDGERFLLDFIKNKKWIDSHNQDEEEDDNSANHKPSPKDGKNHDDDESSSGDVDRADEFEAKYNFRYEQAAAQTASTGALLSVQTYARGQTMNTVRRQDTTRKDKRQERKERKAAERKAKEEQLKRLKNAKRQELNRKLSQVKAVIGAADDNAIDEVAIMKLLEGDYDPEKFENAMKEAYGDEFYNKEDREWKTDLDVRQSLKEDEEGDVLVGQDDASGGMYDTYDGDGGENEDDQMQEDGQDYDETEEWDEDVNEGYEQEGFQEESELEKKLKAKMQEELYKLDYEDIVAGMPTRFKYREVEPNDYGLTTQEILFARDTSLKQFVSLKRLAPYNEQGEFLPGSKKRRRFREMLKQDLEEIIPETVEKETRNDAEDESYESGGKNAVDAEPKKKRRRRLKKGKKKSDIEDGAAESKFEDNGTVTESKRIENQISDDSAKKHSRPRTKSRSREDMPGDTFVNEVTKEPNDVNVKHHENKVGRGKDTAVGSSDKDKCLSTVQKTKSKRHLKGEKENTRKSKRKKSKQDKIAGLTSSRLAAYGL